MLTSRSPPAALLYASLIRSTLAGWAARPSGSAVVRKVVEIEAERKKGKQVAETALIQRRREFNELAGAGGSVGN